MDMGDAVPVPVAKKRKTALRCGLGTQVWLPANAVVKKHPGQKRNVQKLFPHNQHLGKWLVGKTVGQEKVTTGTKSTWHWDVRLVGLDDTLRFQRSSLELQAQDPSVVHGNIRDLLETAAPAGLAAAADAAGIADDGSEDEGGRVAAVPGALSVGMEVFAPVVVVVKHNPDTEIHMRTNLFEGLAIPADKYLRGRAVQFEHTDPDGHDMWTVWFPSLKEFRTLVPKSNLVRQRPGVSRDTDILGALIDLPPDTELPGGPAAVNETEQWDTEDKVLVNIEKQKRQIIWNFHPPLDRPKLGRTEMDPDYLPAGLDYRFSTELVDLALRFKNAHAPAVRRLCLRELFIEMLPLDIKDMAQKLNDLQNDGNGVDGWVDLTADELLDVLLILVRSTSLGGALCLGSQVLFAVSRPGWALTPGPIQSRMLSHLVHVACRSPPLATEATTSIGISVRVPWASSNLRWIAASSSSRRDSRRS